MTATNFDTTKAIIRGLVRYKLTEVEYAFCLYLLDQQYGYGPEKGTKGDSSGYGHLSVKLFCTPSAVKKAVDRLLDMKIIIKEVRATRFGNRYKFNENVELWRNRTKPTSKKKLTRRTDSTSGTDSTNQAQIDSENNTKSEPDIDLGNKLTPKQLIETELLPPETGLSTIGKPLGGGRDSTEVVEHIAELVVEQVLPSVVELVIPNNIVSTINNLTVNDQTVNDSSSLSF